MADIISIRATSSHSELSHHMEEEVTDFSLGDTESDAGGFSLMNFSSYINLSIWDMWLPLSSVFQEWHPSCPEC